MGSHRSTALAIAVLPWLASGCSSSVEPAPDHGPTEFTSGSRLRARYVDLGGGAHLFQGFFDTKLGVACHFMPADDGATRCLPYSPSTGIMRFSDASCTQPVFDASVCPPPAGTFVDAPTSNGCETRQHFFRIGSQLAPQTAFDLSDSGCMTEVSPNKTLYAVTPAAPTEFVSATPRSIALDHGLTTLELVAEDGARQLVGPLTDVKRGVECAPPFDPDATAQPCIPSNPAALSPLGPFGNGTCSEEIIRVTPSPCGSAKPSIIVTGTAHACAPPTFDYFELGASLPPSSTFDTVNSTCVAHPADDTTNYRVGPPIQPSTFPQLSRLHDGKDRFRVDRWVTASGKLTDVSNQGFDTATGRPCFLSELTDGSYQCVPIDGAVFTSAFSDPACTIPIVDMHTAMSDPCAKGPWIVVPTSLVCGTGIALEARKVGNPYTGGDVYQPFYEGCQKTTLDPNAVLYEVGPPVDLPKLHAVTE